MDFEQYHKMAFESHRDALLDQEEINSAGDWARQFTSEEDLSDEELEDLNFYGFYRCYPVNNQNLAILGTNPKSAPTGKGDQAFEFSRFDGDFQKIKNLSVEKMDYFSSNFAAFGGLLKNTSNEAGATGILQGVVEETDIIGKPNYQEESYYEAEFYQDVYYTNAFKFGSPESNYIPDWWSDEMGSLLKKELDMINPDLVLMLGTSYPKLSDEDGIQSIHGTKRSLHGYDVIPLIHPTAYGGNVTQASKKTSEDVSERYRRNLRELSK